ncbi:MAG: DoxX family protein [Proteobacteria bacterium]|nr:DoxX family protein [Pseudomonadota bacterium]
MPANLQPPLALVGRVLLALMFVLAGLSKLTGFGGTVGYIASQGLPVPSLLTAASIVLELGGGIALMLGWQARGVALAMGLFTLVVSFIFHPFWAVPAEQHMVVQLLFMKNISVAGGMFLVAALGAGPLSLDARRAAATAIGRLTGRTA